MTTYRSKKITELPFIAPSLSGVTVIVENGITYESTLESLKCIFSGETAPGSSGTSGTSGTSGSSGTSGTSGSSGTSGTSGSSGSSGTRGTSGTSGTSGTAGTSGTSGSSGSSGTRGTSGTSGTSGSSGSSGSSGTGGTSGSSGSSGTRGTSGTSGTSGTAGTSGTSGNVNGILNIIIDTGGISIIPTGITMDIQWAFSADITGWCIMADQQGSIVIDIWEKIFSGFPPTVANTITGSEKPTLSNQTTNSDMSLSTWTSSLESGDVWRINVDSAASVTRVTVSFYYTRTS